MAVAANEYEAWHVSFLAVVVWCLCWMLVAISKHPSCHYDSRFSTFETSTTSLGAGTILSILSNLNGRLRRTIERVAAAAPHGAEHTDWTEDLRKVQRTALSYTVGRDVTSVT